MTAPPANGALTLHLLSLGRLHILPGEMQVIVLHRHLLSLYLVILFVLVGLDTNDAARSLPVELRGAIYVCSMTAFMLAAMSGFAACARIAKRRGSFSIHLSPILFASTLCSVIVGESLLRMFVPDFSENLTRLTLLLVFHYLVAELAATIVNHRLIPLILAELRGLPIRTLAESDPALWMTETPRTPARPAPPLPDGFLEADGVSFPFQALIHLQADGNYVHLRANDRTALLPGPLSDLVGQLPDPLGMQVHRSHWVAASALVGWQAKGRDITLRLKGGQTVPVAVTRRHAVRNWLTGLGLPRSDAP
ncbi:hypothetical protein HYN69_01340 [Gemmobacter aquarius]|uniref:HTH LytTR-type domain-containing protein n=1 Tax=Paragemmobacter aquarius TaxID=2169400 RepID=A0A2S0UHM1_9RHOB|nr:LytTR family DNA-binding domain-containing protein [Gemmobacter aquarius]AWB47328.1 hypothetical protein HYN69_01340 [Gemmobacter aquarius]